MVKITIECTAGELMEIFPKELWTMPDEKEPTKEDQVKASNIKRKLKWRDKRPGTKVFKNDQIITDVEMRGGTLVFHYYMANDPNQVEYEFRVPSDNLPFIEEAVEAGIIEVDKPLWVHVESDKNRQDKWIIIEEK